MSSLREIEDRETDLIRKLSVLAATLESVRQQKRELQQQERLPPQPAAKAAPWHAPAVALPVPCPAIQDVGVSVAFVWTSPGRIDLQPLQQYVASSCAVPVRWDAGPVGSDLVVFAMIVGGRFDPVEQLRRLHESGATLSCAAPQADFDERLLPAGSAVVGEPAHDFRRLASRQCVLALAPAKQGPWPVTLGGLWVADMLFDPSSGKLCATASSVRWLVDAIGARARTGTQ